MFFFSVQELASSFFLFVRCLFILTASYKQTRTSTHNSLTYKFVHKQYALVPALLCLCSVH